MQLNYAMENYNTEDIADIENFLTTHNIEFQSLLNKIRIYFDNGGQIDVIFNKEIQLTFYNINYHSKCLVCKNKHEVMKIINKL